MSNQQRLLGFIIVCLICIKSESTSLAQELGANINKSGSNITGVTFRVWAPNATNVVVRGPFGTNVTWGATNSFGMTKDNATGYWTTTVTAARPGQEYKYVLKRAGDTNDYWKHDPRAVWIRNGNSVIYDHGAFDWGTNYSRPTIPVDQQVMYEMHIGTFYDPDPYDGRPGTFSNAISRLDYLQRLGVNVIALMPVNEFGGDFSWGYNPEHPFAIESAYGGPDGLKSFVRAAHQKGIKVQLDVVHNHWNPSGDGIWEFDGPGNIYFYGDEPLGWTEWGRRPNYSQSEVQRFIRENIEMLLRDFRIDGLRWDSPQNFLGYDANATKTNIGNPQTVIPEGKSLMTEINRMIWTNSAYTNRWSIAEDAELLVPVSVVNYPTDSFLGQLQVTNTNETFHGHWQTSFHNTITPQIASNSPNVASILGKVNGWSEPPGYRIIFTDNHDKAGNLNIGKDPNNPLLGWRLANRMDPSNQAVLYPQPTLIRTNSILDSVVRKKVLLNSVLTFTAPGTPMLWMGQEFGATDSFRDGRRMDWREASLQHRIFRAHHDLIDLRKNLPALRNSQLDTVVGGLDEVNRVILFWRRNPGIETNDMAVLMNFSSQVLSYNILFPSGGDWYTRLNTDWLVYGADFTNVGPSESFSVGSGGTAPVTIAPYSAIIFTRSARPTGVAIEDGNANGLADGWEAIFGVASVSADEDSDGLSNSFEILNGLDPLEKDTATVVLDGVTNTMRTESNNPNAQFILWATQSTPFPRFPTYTFLSNTITGTTLTNPAGGYLRLALNLTNLASNSAAFFSPNTNLSQADINRTNWAKFYAVTNFNDNPDGDAFIHLQEFGRGSDPYTSNRTGLYLAGVDNGWNASNRPMTFLGGRLWICDFPAPKNATREFKLTDGRDWGININWGDDQPDGLADPGSSRNLAIKFTKGGISRFQVDEGIMSYQVIYDATDVNGDGIQDAWVAFYGLTGPNASSSADFDGDGWANLIEMNRATSPQEANPKRMSVVGQGALPVAPWNPAANNMVWSDGRNQWEWIGTASTSGDAVMKFTQGPNWSDPEWGTNASGRIELSAQNITNTVVGGTRYKISFNDVSLTYSISNYPESTEWWETNNLPVNGLWFDDTDGDGNNQLMEFALGGDPNVAETNRLFSSWATNSVGTNRLVLRWNQRTNANVQAEWQTNLSGTGWSSIGLIISNVGSSANGMQPKEASVPIDSTNRKFLRLKVTGP